MVTGLDIFKQYFKEYANSYVIIGGTACAEQHADLGLDFRATKDIDLVLCMDAISNTDFGEVFKQFIRDGGYSRQGGEKPPNLARLQYPSKNDYPKKIELIANCPITELLPVEQNKMPISLGDCEYYDFSAFIMEAQYYKYLQNHKEVKNDLSIASVDCLMILKAKAWLSLRERRESGLEVDSKNINKHKNDFFRLFQILNHEDEYNLPVELKNDVKSFLIKATKEGVDLKSLRIAGELSDIVDEVYRVFELGL